MQNDKFIVIILKNISKLSEVSIFIKIGPAKRLKFFFFLRIVPRLLNKADL